MKIRITKKKYDIFSVLSYLFMLVMICIIFIGIQQVFDSTSDKEKESLQNAITRNIIECYALEGRYPESLDYIEEHYGLTYNKDKFYVAYKPIAENMMPDVTIVELK